MKQHLYVSMTNYFFEYYSFSENILWFQNFNECKINLCTKLWHHWYHADAHNQKYSSGSGFSLHLSEHVLHSRYCSCITDRIYCMAVIKKEFLSQIKALLKDRTEELLIVTQHLALNKRSIQSSTLESKCIFYNATPRTVLHIRAEGCRKVQRGSQDYISEF